MWRLPNPPKVTGCQQIEQHIQQGHQGIEGQSQALSPFIIGAVKTRKEKKLLVTGKLHEEKLTRIVNMKSIWCKQYDLIRCQT